MWGTDADIVHMIRNAGPMVQFVLLLLFFFSVTSWTIVIIKFRMLRHAYNDSMAFVEQFWKSPDLANAFTKAKQFSSCPIGRVFRVAYMELSKLEHGTGKEGENIGHLQDRSGLDNIKRALTRATRAEITKMTGMLSFLATTGNTTPFISLFGTVWGIMNSFHGIGVKGSANLAAVAPGISEALIATAAGLAVAIPAVIAFNFFVSKIRVIESELDNFSSDLLNILEREMIRGKGK